MPKKLSTEEWINKAYNAHGGFYSYEKTEYKSAKVKVVITCPRHGDFLQTPDSHTRGNGCPNCKRQTLANLRQKDLSDFTSKARKVHGDVYDYRYTVYSGAKSKICIKCKLHGEFEQLATNHLSGLGCPKCGRERTTQARKLTKDKFIERAYAAHGKVYDYAETVITGATIKSEIKCENHGSFSQTPASHMAGNGCPRCGDERVSSLMLGSLEEFVSKAAVVHEDSYDYSEAVYVSATEKLRIICRKHGPFMQTPNQHLGGRGCSGCAKYGFQQNKPAWFYYARIDAKSHPRLWMVGITNRSFLTRYSERDRSFMTLLHEEYFESGANALEFETTVLKSHNKKLYLGRSPLRSKGGGAGISREIFTEDILELDA